MIVHSSYGHQNINQQLHFCFETFFIQVFFLFGVIKQNLKTIIIALLLFISRKLFRKIGIKTQIYNRELFESLNTSLSHMSSLPIVSRLFNQRIQ